MKIGCIKGRINHHFKKLVTRMSNQKLYKRSNNPISGAEQGAILQTLSALQKESPNDLLLA